MVFIYLMQFDSYMLTHRHALIGTIDRVYRLGISSERKSLKLLGKALTAPERH